MNGPDPAFLNGDERRFRTPPPPTPPCVLTKIQRDSSDSPLHSSFTSSSSSVVLSQFVERGNTSSSWRGRSADPAEGAAAALAAAMISELIAAAAASAGSGSGDSQSMLRNTLARQCGYASFPDIALPPLQRESAKPPPAAIASPAGEPLSQGSWSTCASPSSIMKKADGGALFRWPPKNSASGLGRPKRALFDSSPRQLPTGLLSPQKSRPPFLPTPRFVESTPSPLSKGNSRPQETPPLRQCRQTRRISRPSLEKTAPAGTVTPPSASPHLTYPQRARRPGRIRKDRELSPPLTWSEGQKLCKTGSRSESAFVTPAQHSRKRRRNSLPPTSSYPPWREMSSGSSECERTATAPAFRSSTFASATRKRVSCPPAIRRGGSGVELSSAIVNVRGRQKKTPAPYFKKGYEIDVEKALREIESPTIVPDVGVGSSSWSWSQFFVWFILGSLLVGSVIAVGTVFFVYFHSGYSSSEEAPGLEGYYQPHFREPFY